MLRSRFFGVSLAVEPSRRVTLEELRRSMVLYPDHDLTGRLWEIGAERLPLFGEDE